MMTITEFLLARITADEAWVTERYAGVTIGIVPDDQRIVPFPGSIDRTMAECEAKRRIVEVHYEWEVDDETYGWISLCGACSPEKHPCTTLRALAAIYADHDDYREEWRA